MECEMVIRKKPMTQEAVKNEFNFELYNPKFPNEPDKLKIVWTEDGWNIITPEGKFINKCRRNGFPYITRYYESYLVVIPLKVDFYFERLWTLVKDGADHKKVQRGLDELNKWIKSLNESKPEGNMWEEAKIG